MEKQKVVLVFAGKKDLNKPKISLSILSLAPYLKKAGFEVEILDTRVDSYDNLNLDNVVLVGFSTTTGNQIKYSLDVAKHIRERNPKIPLVWGGIHPSLLPEETLLNPYVDIVVRGEGEETLQELAIALREHTNLKAVKGIFFKENDKVVSTEPRKLMDLTDLKRPAYDLVDKSKYDTSYIHYFFSRGCPYKCRFCCESVWGQGNTYRTRRTDSIIADLKYIKDTFNPEAIFFVDDNALVHKAKVRGFCTEIIKQKLDIKYVLQSRFEYIARADVEFMMLLKESGCIILHFGGESGSQQILDYINKDISLGDMVNAIEVCKKYDIVPLVSFMVGFPKESPEDVYRTLHFIDKLAGIYEKMDLNGISLVMLYPGTALYEEALSLGFKPPQSLEEWSDYNLGRTFDMPWIPVMRKNYLLTLEFVTRFPVIARKDKIYCTHYSIYRTRKRLPLLQKIAYQFYLRDARFRWKHKWFGCGLEWGLFNFMRRGHFI